MKRLVFLSLEKWDDIWRRNQFICRELIARHADLQILWVNPIEDVRAFSAAGIQWLLAAAQTASTETVADYPAIRVLQPKKALPNSIAYSTNMASIRLQLERAIIQLGWGSFVLWINNQALRPVSDLPGRTGLIYDVTDDWAHATLNPLQRRRVIEDDDWLLDHADELIVCSEALLRSKSGRRKNIRLIPNGVDHERYSPAALSRCNPQPEFLGLPRPIVGYTGTLHEDRLDLQLIAEIAKALPHVSFVFVGPNCLSEPSTKLLASLSNCHLLGARPYALLPNYLAEFSVCFVPHKVTPFTDSLDPLKLYEFMSTGKPIVATACGGFRDHAGLIHIAASAAQFAQQISANLQGDGKEDARIAWASQFGWSRRVEEIEPLLAWNG